MRRNISVPAEIVLGDPARYVFEPGAWLPITAGGEKGLILVGSAEITDTAVSWKSILPRTSCCMNCSRYRKQFQIGTSPEKTWSD
jgi:hypothetical protein